MNISNQKMVTLSYTLRKGDKKGEIIEKTTDANPLKFVYGMGLMLPMFEENLLGKKMGEAFEMSIAAAEAYGEVDKDAIVDIPKDIFVFDGVFDAEKFAVGCEIPMQTSDGRHLNGTILEVGDASLKMDFNHPLAGIDLFFEGDIIEVRDASDEELAALTQGCGGGCGSCGGSCGSQDGEDCGSNCGCGGCE